MPVQYEGILAEYEQTRRRVSVFDTSHMGEFFIDGDAVASGFDHLVTQPISPMPLKACHYGVLLNEEGGIIDDLIVYRLAPERWMIVVN
ncbi:MAG: glycine cleavage system protein T, partial [Candidatus Omnitrophica bacterium]|nr:glycine cleavage system protein T [Candidatus Omnitrophota bacterium]